jgi:hypothetical protein
MNNYPFQSNVTEREIERNLNYPGARNYDASCEPVYRNQFVHRGHSETNETRDTSELYEYAKPITVVGKATSSMNYKIDNPFNTECEMAILYANNFDTAFIQVSFDQITLGPITYDTNGFTGYLLPGGQSTLYQYWTTVKEYANIVTSTPVNGYVMTFGFRRKLNLFIPRNLTEYGEPGSG